VQNLNGGTFTVGSGNAPIAATGDIWTGCVSTDWATAGNWLDGSVPTAGDNVIIPDVTNDPVITGGTAALANSVHVQTAAALTINATGSLTINGLATFVFPSFSLTIGFYNQGTVSNSGNLVLGSTGSMSDYGLLNTATFNNNPGGEISIDRSAGVGLNNFSGTFTNAAKITIGAVTGMGTYGILNEATFNNNSGGDISIDRSTSIDLWNKSNTFTNAAKITIGAVTSASSIGILNDATFNNSTCGALVRIASNVVISNPGSLTNAGIIIENASGNSSITSNSGIVQNLNGGTFTVGSGNAPVAATGDIWTGCVSTNWATAGNWHDGSVPTAGDNVTIPDVTNDPVITAGTMAVANSVQVQTSAALTINAMGSLTINGSGIFSGIGSVGFYNQGIVSNSGNLVLGSTASVGDYGIYNQATFNNNIGGEMSIDRSTQISLFNRGGTFTNAAKITIGTVAAVGGYGINNFATFNNNIGGEISVDRSSITGLYNNSGGTFYQCGEDCYWSGGGCGWWHLELCHIQQ
jgi:hypothetical protein